ncbi:GNAT family N-acetyltransferase [Sphingobacterium sp. SYP-B4668]|uniref:GNAT family N-acetyltransferase n=1 Tax=Sphingobacterium sp. SYP-B4668 TaxID=2996035 RepID=UPI0022DCE7D8|nr:GNAT family N-acetyltransferase [Sphingobacterium sp. SYP-B4668]
MDDTTLHIGEYHQLKEMQTLFVETIHAICNNDYTPQQIAAWTAGIENQSRWEDRLLNQFVVVAKKENLIVGFCTFDKKEYLDMLFVHKDFQRQGIANLLYQKIEQEAIRRHGVKLMVDASITARPFFEKMGFFVVTEQTVIRKGVTLTNYEMTKMLQ